MLKSQIEHALQQSVPVHLLTDSKLLFDIISKGSRTGEKRVMLDVHDTREGNKAKEISNIVFVRSSENLADGLTKEKVQKSLLKLAMSGKHHSNYEQ